MSIEQRLIAEVIKGLNLHKDVDWEYLYEKTTIASPEKPLAYISGKMTGIEGLNLIKFLECKERFDKDFNCIIPHFLFRKGTKLSYRKIMAVDVFIMTMVADVIIVLDDWYKSRGALNEIFNAQFHDIKIITSYGEDFKYSMTLEPFTISCIKRSKKWRNKKH